MHDVEVSVGFGFEDGFVCVLLLRMVMSRGITRGDLDLLNSV